MPRLTRIATVVTIVEGSLPAESGFYWQSRMKCLSNRYRDKWGPYL